MPYDPLASVAPEIHQRASRIGLVCLDVDGTLTDGRLYFDNRSARWSEFTRRTHAFIRSTEGN